MVFVKVVKNKAYFKRYQVKYRRRREAKTDYYARTRLIAQDKNKYNAPKYRLVVRFSNKACTVQVVQARVEGDHVLAAAASTELTQFGLPAAVGIANYAAAYATGLLCARRLLAKHGLSETYEGKVEVDGEDFNVEHEDEDGPRPFKTLLDVGLRRTTTGARLFGAMKGAADGGLFVPHTEKRFPGYSKEGGHDAEKLREHILGVHVANFMEHLQEKDAGAYQRQFSRYIAAGINAGDVEGMWKRVHQAIRANPNPEKPKKQLSKSDVDRSRKWANTKRLTGAQKRANLQKKIAIMRQLREAE